MPLALNIGAVLLVSIAVYFAIRFLAYRRSFPLPHIFDFLWLLNTLLVSFLFLVFQPPLAVEFSAKFVTWLTFAVYLLSSYLAIFVLDQFIVEHYLVSIAKIYVSPPLREVMKLFIFAVAVVIGVQKIFSINPWAVYAPTSLLSLGIGIALKDAFQTFFAGVGLSNIIRIGDWVSINDKEGEVVDINWSRTTLRSKDGTFVFVPNRHFQNDHFQCYGYRNGKFRCTLEIGASYNAPPQRVKKVLIDCAKSAEGVLSSPAPEALIKGYGDSAINYTLFFWIGDYEHSRELSSDVSTRVWYAFKRENIEIPFPIRTLHVVRKGAGAQEEGNAVKMLSNIDLFKMLSEDDNQYILERLLKQVYLQGETVVNQGDPGSSFYLVVKGRLEVLRNTQDGKNVLLTELGPGQFFGELSLLTGEPRTATVRSASDSELLRLEKEDFQEILKRHPAMAENLADVVSSRQSTLSEVKDVKAGEDALPEKKSALSRRIRKFFNLNAQ